MSKPAYFDIFGKRIYIQYKKLEEDMYGEYKSKEGIIEIDESLDGELLYDTLVHELIHALFDRVGIGHVVQHDVEEIICRCAAAVFIENDLVNIPEPE